MHHGRRRPFRSYHSDEVARLLKLHASAFCGLLFAMRITADPRLPLQARVRAVDAVSADSGPGGQRSRRPRAKYLTRADAVNLRARCERRASAVSAC